MWMRNNNCKVSTQTLSFSSVTICDWCQTKATRKIYPLSWPIHISAAASSLFSTTWMEKRSKKQFLLPAALSLSIHSITAISTMTKAAKMSSSYYSAFNSFSIILKVSSSNFIALTSIVLHLNPWTHSKATVLLKESQHYAHSVIIE